MKLACLAAVAASAALAQTYDANGPGAVIGGGANLGGCGGCPTGTNAQNLGGPNGGTLTFKDITVPKDGLYTLKLIYDNAREFDLPAGVSANGGRATKVSLPGTGSWFKSSTATVNVRLRAGTNTLHIGSLPGAHNWVAEITSVSVAPAGSAPGPAAVSDGTSAQKIPTTASGAPVSKAELTTPGPAASVLAATGQAPPLPANATKFSGGDLQGAIDAAAAAGKSLEVTAGNYPTGPLRLPSNFVLYLDAGATVQARPGAFPGTNDELLTVKGASNVSIFGVPGKSVFQGAGGGQSGEWRHCLGIHSGRNVQINGVQCNGSGGDGLYISGSSTGISVANSTFDGNKRNGMSVISVNGLTVTNCTFSRTNGTAPRAGIDFEPNSGSDNIQNALIQNSRSVNNGGHGFMLSLGFHRGGLPTSITIRDCVSSGNGGNGYFGWGGGSAGGTILIENSTSNDAKGATARDGWTAGDGSLLFHNVT